VRAVSGPLATVRGVRPTVVGYNATAEPLRDVRVALRANIRAVLERVTLADLAAGTLPAAIRRLTTDPRNRCVGVASRATQESEVSSA